MMISGTLYEAIGGEDNIRKLVDRFYDLMDTAPEAAGIRGLHPPDLTESREKLYLFLSDGWAGLHSMSHALAIHGCAPGMFPFRLEQASGTNGLGV